MRVFVAGATGALGKRLVPLLLGAGHEVFGMTRSAEKAQALEREGVRGIVADAFDEQGLRDRLIAAAPELIFHALTDLPYGTNPADMAQGSVRNARMRREGTRNLVAAALASGARKMIAESIAWVFAPGREPHVETDALATDAPEPFRTTVSGVVELEKLVLGSPPLVGVVLRYGHLYGPGTGHDHADETVNVHVDSAAWAALLAMDLAGEGVFNVVEDNPHVSNAKARSVLGWDPQLRLSHVGGS